jgi:hypothetical protein
MLNPRRSVKHQGGRPGEDHPQQSSLVDRDLLCDFRRLLRTDVHRLARGHRLDE